jgi:hypothetical protein
VSNLTDDEIVRLIRAVHEGRCTVQYAVDIILLGPADWSHTPSCPCDRCEDYRGVMGMSQMYGLGPRPDTERPHHLVRWT